MISLDEACQQVISSVVKLPHESVPLKNAFGRILAVDTYSDIDMPPFNKSAMDGYACRKEDINNRLKLIETISAGYIPQRELGPNECSKIMTGGKVPDGADWVVMVENTSEKEGFVFITDPGKRSNICLRAEDIKKGDPVLKTGTRIGAAETGILATIGCDPVTVSCQPVIGILATGNELVEPSLQPNPVQIRNSSSTQLCAQIENAGCKAIYYGIAQDTPEEIDRMLKRALNECDVIILTGGVSEGDFDFVPSVLSDNKINIKFRKVAVKPGKPTVFGTKENKFFFGMPGNPVSTFVIFEILVKQFLYRLMGHNFFPTVIKAPLKNDFQPKKSDRDFFIPVYLDTDGFVNKIEYHGSAHINAFSTANGILKCKKNSDKIKAGTLVEIQLIA